MNMARQARFWLFAFLGLCVVVYFLGQVITPFAVAFVIAYFVSPISQWLVRRGLPSWAAATILMLIGIAALAIALILLVPLAIGQLQQALEALPRTVDWVRTTAVPRLEELVSTIGPDDMERIRSAASDYAGTAAGWVIGFLKGLLSGVLLSINLISILVITPIVAFYLIRDWDGIIARIDSLLPRAHREVIRREMAEVNRTLSGFIRGQATVCLSLGSFYALALSVVGLNFGLVVGFVAGCLSFIPYVGSIFGFCTSVGIAFFQFDSWTMRGVVAAIFLFGQAVEGNVLTPKLVGDSVGLPAVWVIFALLAGGSLFGFTGVLLAVPVAAVIGVLVRFLLRQYLASSYFEDAAKPAAMVPAAELPTLPPSLGRTPPAI